MLREVISQEPYQYGKGTKERGEVWTNIAQTVNTIPDVHFKHTQRGVRTQFDKLFDDFLKDDRQQKLASGIDQPCDEVDQLLCDINNRVHEANEELAKQAGERSKKQQDEENQANDVRIQAMQRQGSAEKEGKKRKSATVLVDMLNQGREVKRQIEMEKITIEQQRLDTEKERNKMFLEMFTKQQTQNEQFMQVVLQQQQEMRNMQLVNSQVQLEVLKSMKDLK